MSIVTSVRMTPSQEQLIKQAAALDSRTVSNFMVAVAVREAEMIVRRHRRAAKAEQSEQPEQEGGR